MKLSACRGILRVSHPKWHPAHGQATLASLSLRGDGRGSNTEDYCGWTLERTLTHISNPDAIPSPARRPAWRRWW